MLRDDFPFFEKEITAHKGDDQNIFMRVAAVWEKKQCYKAGKIKDDYYADDCEKQDISAYF